MATAVEKHKGIIKPGKKFQARIFYPASASTQGHEGGPRGIGSFESFTEAVAALEAAQAKFDVGGEAAVWDGPKASRAKRNAVRCFTQTYTDSGLYVLSPQSLCHRLTCTLCLLPDSLVRH